MATPRIERAIIAIVAQLATILTAGGYHTNAGAKVVRARRSFTKAECPAISVFEVGETPKDGTGRTMVMTVELEIDVHVSCTQEDTGTLLGLAKADVKQCLGAWDCDGGVKDGAGRLGALVYGGATGNAREDGAATESVTLKYSIAITEARKDPAKQAPHE